MGREEATGKEVAESKEGSGNVCFTEKTREIVEETATLFFINSEDEEIIRESSSRSSRKDEKVLRRALGC